MLTTREIQERLSSVEKDYNIKILYACQSEQALKIPFTYHCLLISVFMTFPVKRLTQTTIFPAMQKIQLDQERPLEKSQ